MAVQTAKVKEVIFAGNQFFQPFSHSPMWLEELIERGDIFKRDGEWSYVENGWETKQFKQGDKLKPNSDGVNRFEVIRNV